MRIEELALSRSLVLLVLLCLSSVAQAGKDKVLLFGIDGLKVDALNAIAPPNLMALAQRGIYSSQSFAPDISLSGPGWATVLTGVERDKHGVVDNEFSGRNFVYAPHLLTLIKRQNPQLVTAYAYNWGPLYKKFQPEADLIYTGPPEDDARLINQAAQWLRQRNDLDVLSTYFYNLDEAGHRFGFNASIPQYRDQLLKADAALGQLLAAINTRPNRAKERWLIMVVTDHGGSGTQHGENRPEHRRVPLIMAGDGIAAQSKAFIPLALRQVDIVPTVLAHLGLTAQGLDLDGKPYQPQAYNFRTGVNLLANPDAEYGSAHTDPNYDPDIPGWHKGGRQTVMSAGSRAALPARGGNLFVGLGTGSLTQVIPLPTQAAGRPFQLQAQLGASIHSAHDVQLHVRFRGTSPRAALQADAGASYFLRGERVERFDYATDRISSGYPRLIVEQWPDLARFQGGARDIEAAFNAGNGKAFFFKGSQVIRYDLARNRADSGYPQSIAAVWPDLARFRRGAQDLDAVLAVSEQEVYFFQGSQFIRYDLKAGRAAVDDPLEISELTWPGLGVWPLGIDAAVQRDSETAYLFNGHEYIRFSLKRHEADNRVPRAVNNSSWTGIQNFNQSFWGSTPLSAGERDGQWHLRQVRGQVPAGAVAAEVELRFLHEGSGGFPFADALEFRVD